MTSIKRTLALMDNIYMDGPDLFAHIEIGVEIEGQYYPEDKASEFSPPSDAYMEILPYRYEFPVKWSFRRRRHQALVLTDLLNEDKKKIEKLLIEQYKLDEEANEIDRGTE
jgi:hypothetical protein